MDMLLETASEEQKMNLEKRIDEVKVLLDDIKHKKEDIIKLQHGKAGYVYVISNLGSFGDDVFKIGMN